MTYNRTVMDMLYEGKDFIGAACQNYCWELFATFVFLLLISWGRKFWLQAINFLTFLEAVLYIINPERMISLFISEGKLDSVHLELVRGIGLLLLMWALSYWLLSKSTDSTIDTSFLWTQAIMVTCIMICQGYLLTHPGKKGGVKLDNKAMTTAFYSCMLMTVGTYYYAMRSNDFAGYAEVSSHANLHLRFDFVLLMVMGTLLYSMPQWVLRIQFDFGGDKIDSFHAYLARCCGAIMIAMSFMVGRAANFLRGADKQAVVLTHLMYYVIAIAAGWYCRLKDTSSLSWRLTGVLGIHDMAIILNALGALNADYTVVERIFVSRLMEIPKDVTRMYRDIRYNIRLKRY